MGGGGTGSVQLTTASASLREPALGRPIQLGATKRRRIPVAPVCARRALRQSATRSGTRKMNNTILHLAYGIGWLFGVPVTAIIAFSVGLIPEGSPASSAVVSVLWALGLLALFASWAIRDAPVHGKSRYVAATFTVLWLVIPVVVIFPYLFTTRGAKEGLLASLKLASLLLALAVIWMGAFRLTGAMFS